MRRLVSISCLLGGIIALAAFAVRCASSPGTPGTNPAQEDASPGPLPDGAVDASVDASAPPDSAPETFPDATVDGKADAAKDGSADARVEADADAAPPLFHPCPPAGTACVIMPLGDSITFGYKSTTGGGYRIELLTDIWGANHDATFVGTSTSGPTTLAGKPFPQSNEGHSGYTIDDAPAVGRSGISPLVPASLMKYTPHIVTLMIGTNDVDTMNDLANAPARLGKLLDTITTTSPNALLVVAQITPTGTDAENVRVQAFNAAIPALVMSRAAAGKHVILVDMYAALTANPAYRTADMADGLHPNDTGYAVLGDTWYAALAPYL
jgi:lysophospholipase L1-like esterase